MNTILSLFLIGLGNYVSAPLSEYIYTKAKEKLGYTTSHHHAPRSLKESLIKPITSFSSALQKSPSKTEKSLVILGSLISIPLTGMSTKSQYGWFFPQGPSYNTLPGASLMFGTSMVTHNLGPIVSLGLGLLCNTLSNQAMPAAQCAAA